MKKIILPIAIVAAALMSSPALAEEFAYYNENTVCVYAEPGEAYAGKNVSVILCADGDEIPAHAGECIVDEDGSYFYKFEFTVPEDKTLESDYELLVRVDGEAVKTFTVTEKPENVSDYKINAVDDSLLNSEIKIKNLFGDEGEYSFYAARTNDEDRLQDVVTAEKRAFSYGWRGESDSAEALYCNNGEHLSAYIWDGMKPIAKSLEHSADYISKFEDGDVVAIAGDSIVHLGNAPSVLEHFYQTREPDKSIRVINAGVGGDVVGGKIGEENSYGILARLDWDVYHENPNKIFINSGANDLLYSLYTPEDSDITTGYKSIRYESCIENYKNLVDTIEADGKEVTLLGEASIYDEADYEGAVVAENKGFNAAVSAFDKDLEKVAEEKSVEYLSLNSFFNEITENYRAENPNAAVLHGPDRIHLNDAGSFIYGAMILIHQGVDARAAETSIDVLNGSTYAYNADVNVTDRKSNSVSYTYAPKAIPMAVNSWYTDAEKIIPVTEYLNQEIISVKNLESGTYTVKFTNAGGEEFLLGDFTSDELNKGINIATNEANPSQQQSKLAMQQQEARYWYDMGTLRKTVQDSEERQTTGTMSAENLAALNEMKAVSKGYSDEAKELSKPGTYTVTITKN